jgi:hypothetical protein
MHVRMTDRLEDLREEVEQEVEALRLPKDPCVVSAQPWLSARNAMGGSRAPDRRIKCRRLTAPGRPNEVETS